MPCWRTARKWMTRSAPAPRMEFDSKFLTAVSTASSGNLPAKKSFVRVSPENIMLSAFRKRPDSGYELRLLETNGKGATAEVELGFSAAHAVETDLGPRYREADGGTRDKFADEALAISHVADRLSGSC